jgi:hypothetical protein
MPHRASTFAAILLLLLMFLLAGGAAYRESVTIDEVAHIGAGLSYVQKLDLRFNEEHPPLAKALAGLPLAIRGTHADYTSPQWTISAKFLPAFLGEWVFGNWVLGRWNRSDDVLFWARLPMLCLTLLLGWTIFVFGRRLGGPWGGLLCLTAFITAPAFLTFGPLVLTDVPIALFAVLTVWTLGELWSNPDRRNVRWFALALAGAILSKFSAAFLMIAIGVYALATRRWAVAGQPASLDARRIWRKLRTRAIWRGIAIAAAVVYAVYFVLSWNQPVDIPGLAGHGWLTSILGRPLMPPWLFLRGLAMMLLTSVRPSFLFGHVYPHGVWFYFPVLAALKSPPGVLGLLILTAVLGLYNRRQSPASPVVPADLVPHWRAIWVVLLVFTGVCLVGPMDISIRHFTVPLALLTLLLAPLPRLIGNVSKPIARPAIAAAALLGASCLVTAVATYPHFMQYASPIGMGRPIHWLMGDSNVDWNQALPEVQQFAQRHGLADVPLDAYSISSNTDAVPASRLWDCQDPAPADAGHWVFVSANLILDSHNCAWILRYPHQPLGGGAMYAIQLPSPIPPAGTPGGPPPPAERRIFLHGPMDMREVLTGVTDHPERIQIVFDDMVVRFSKMQAESARKK